MSDSAGNTLTAAAPERERSTRGVSTGWRASGRFWLALGALLATAIGMHVLAIVSDSVLRKERLDLKRHLYELDRIKLLPTYELHPNQPPPLEQETLENLGTDEYLQWNLRDRTRDFDDPTSMARLFVTYNTGRPDLVPHNPRECMQASGGWRLVSDTLIEIEAAHPTAGPQRIPVAVLEFEAPRASGVGAALGREPPRQTVLFFMEANGQYTTDRTGTRLALGRMRDRYAYYARIEATFVDAGFRRFASRDESIAAYTKLVKTIMPILWEDHFQDWRALERGGAPTAPVQAQGGG